MAGHVTLEERELTAQKCAAGIAASDRRGTRPQSEHDLARTAAELGPERVFPQPRPALGRTAAP